VSVTERENLFAVLDGTLKCCPKQFAQLCGLQVGLGSTSHGNCIYPVLFALYRTKRNNVIFFANSAGELACVLSPKIIKFDFAAVVISAINKVLPHSVVTGCNFHCHQCLWRQIQYIGLTAENKANEQPEVFLPVQTLKEEAELESWQLKSKGPEEPGQKPRKVCNTRRNN
jgi:hypothetical protein